MASNKPTEPASNSGAATPRIAEIDAEGFNVEDQDATLSSTTMAASPRPLVELSVLLPIGGGHHGLRNLGNTCFMNSVLQCLAQTPAMAAFFLDYDRLESCLNTHPKSLGSKGLIGRAFHELLVELWDDRDRMPVAPRAFKTTISRRSERFKGFGQQDAQVGRDS
jgi:ubiquitin C-terminal hydrolase